MMFQDIIPRILDLKLWQLAISAIGFVFAIELGQGIFASFYNVFFSPLKRYPSNFWDIAFPLLQSIDVLKGRLVFTHVKRHEKYGEVVRTGPDELSFTSAQAWKDIHGHTNDLPKTIISIGFLEGSLMMANKTEHGRQRRAVAPAFSEKSLLQQEPLVRVYVDLLIRRLKELRGKPTDTTRWLSLATFDIIGDLAFGTNLQGLEKNLENQWIESITNTIHFIPFLALIQFSRIGGFLVKLLFGPKMRSVKAKQDANIRQLLQDRMAKHERGDFMDHLIGKLPEKELMANADLFMLGGTHTSATLMSGAIYWLLKTPDVYNKVTREVREAFENSSQICFKACEKLPYLQAVINETFRVYPPLPVALTRRTLVPTMICGEMIPANTAVGVTHLAAYLSESNFHRAKEFLPERWLTTDSKSEFYNDKREVLHPFGYGSHDCIGQNLAYHEIRLILSMLLWHFDVEILPESLNWYDQRVFGQWELPPLKVRYLDRFDDVKS